MLLLILACESAQDSGDSGLSEAVECHSLRTEDALPSATQTFSVTWDAAGGRVLATALGLPYLSVVDPKAATRVDAIPIGTAPADNPRVVVDDAGTAWVGALSEPTLQRVAVSERGVAPIAGFGGVGWLVAMDEGVVLPHDGEVIRLDGTGSVKASRAVGSPRAGARVGQGVVVVDGDEALWLTADALDVAGRCSLPFVAERVSALPGGALVVTDGQQVARVGCDGVGGAQTWNLGVDITSLVADGTSVWALDRVGAEDPTRGVAWRVDEAGEPVAAFVTAKNTGFGAIVDGVLWANAEGSSEVMAFDVDSGERLAEVSTGSSVADVVVDDDGGVIGTGRLSALIGRLDGDTVLRAEPLVWPWAPVLSGDRLVLLDHLEGKLASIDAHRLDDLVEVDLGLGPNALLTFDSLVFAPERGTWLVADSEADVLLEVDLLGGAVLTAWGLGGPLPTDPHLASQLELQLLGDVALLARTSDGRLTRLELATGDRHEAWLDAAQLQFLRARRQTRATTLGGEWWWVGPYRIDPETLAVEEVWPQVGGLLAPWPGAAGEWLATTSGGKALVHVSADGEAGATFAWFDEEQPGTVAAIEPGGAAAWVTRSYEGRVCRVPLGLVDAGSARPPA